LPPSSSLLSFLQQNQSISGLVVTDHAREFANKFYNSHYDNRKPAPWIAKITDTATILARVLYSSVSGPLMNDTVKNSIAADSVLVEALLTCLIEDFSCDMVKQYVSNPPAGPLPKYPSVFVLRPRAQITYGIPRLLYGYFTSPKFMNSTTFFHDAVDPHLKLDQNANKWTVLNATDSPIWTESNWPAGIQSRAYQAENPSVEAAMLAVGLILMAFAIAGVHFLNKYLNRRFKTD